MFVGAVALLLTFSACDDGKVNFFTVDQDKQFGKEVFADLRQQQQGNNPECEISDSKKA